MKIDDSIVNMYLNNEDVSNYREHWVFKSIHDFETPKLCEKEWVSLLHDKVFDDAKNLIPRNAKLVYEIFPDFQEVADKFPMILTVGCPDPYDAMVLENNGALYVVFDLLQFVPYVRELYEHGEAYDFRRILTHELIHVSLHNRYSRPSNLSYIDDLNYTAFNEGFAHALAYNEDMMLCKFDKILQNKFEKAKEQLRKAIIETDLKKQSEYLIASDTGNYWDKFASISGKLYLLKNKQKLTEIYKEGWKNFTKKILDC